MDNSEKKTDFLIERIHQNENAQTININEWAFQKIQGNNSKLNILELCCGTGKQTEFLLKNFNNAEISCLDISSDAIETVKKNFSGESHRMLFFNTGIDDFFQNNHKRFDVIFCSYGLYYSTDIDFVLSSIYEVLNPGGRFIVMGPFGKNNKELFDALTLVQVSIPEPVMHSSATFMYEDVLLFTIENFPTNHIYTTRNSIAWKTVESVMSYWKSSTFFNESNEQKFKDIVEKKIEKDKIFINNKHIMLLEAIK